MFNENRGCIEIIPERSFFLFGYQFNENRGCIEIFHTILTPFFQISFNENRGCIEITIAQTDFCKSHRLMKTEVVLKFHEQLYL